MAEPVARFEVWCTYALWPGDGVFCVRMQAPKLVDTFFLVDREGRRHDLRTYSYGMLRGR